MHEYRQVLTRMRLGDSDRAIRNAGLMGRRNVGEIREIAAAAGWLDPGVPLPDDGELAKRLRPRSRRPSTISLVESFAPEVKRWWSEGIAATTITAALRRNRVGTRRKSELLVGFTSDQKDA
jgi:hypothetical protein